MSKGAFKIDFWMQMQRKDAYNIVTKWSLNCTTYEGKKKHFAYFHFIKHISKFSLFLSYNFIVKEKKKLWRRSDKTSQHTQNDAMHVTNYMA